MLTCPHCTASDRPHRWGTSGGQQRYRCRNCLRTFNVRTGTTTARLRHAGKWARYMSYTRRGESIRHIAHSVGVAPSTVQRWHRRPDIARCASPSAVDLFAGCGGLSAGLSEAGIDVIAGFDSWDAALDVYNTNLPHPATSLDLSDVPTAVNVLGRHQIDIIAGEPPCQDFSAAGPRTEGARADLTLAFARIVAEVKPKAVIMENVAQIVGSAAYAEARRVFKEAGYGLTERVLDASRCGVPQNRRRFFCIGIHGAEDGVLDTAIDARLSAKPMSIRDYLGDEPRVAHYYRHRAVQR